MARIHLAQTMQSLQIPIGMHHIGQSQLYTAQRQGVLPSLQSWALS